MFNIIINLIILIGGINIGTDVYDYYVSGTLSTHSIYLWGIYSCVTLILHAIGGFLSQAHDKLKAAQIAAIEDRLIGKIEPIQKNINLTPEEKRVMIKEILEEESKNSFGLKDKE
jgi:hypothetical protein